MIYLDNAATSYPKPEAVYAAMDDYSRHRAANPGRSGHRMAVGSERAIDDVRHRLARFFGETDSSRLIFTLNCTDSLNIAIKGILKSGDHVITSSLEHNSVSRPLPACRNRERSPSRKWMPRPQAISIRATSRRRFAMRQNSSP